MTVIGQKWNYITGPTFQRLARLVFGNSFQEISGLRTVAIFSEIQLTPEINFIPMPDINLEYYLNAASKDVSCYAMKSLSGG
jgi:hypothetical protein